jgi:hypothetical protein
MKNIFKKSIYMVLLGGALALAGCSDLEPVDYSDINPNIFPKNEEDVKSLVNGAYYTFRSDWFDGMFANDDRGIMFINDLTTEILTSSGNWMYHVSTYNYSPTTSDVTRIYYSNTDYTHTNGRKADGYANDVSNCTYLIDQIQNLDFLTDAKKSKYIAEVRCARALTSYMLYDMFGPIVIAPLEMLKNPTASTPIARATTEEMVSFIEEDLNYAAENLPSPSEAEYGRFSTGLAKMLLIRLYLHESKNDKSYYDKVEALAKDLMEGGYGYSLAESYPGIFEVGGQGTANKELIWEIPVNDEALHSWNDWPGTVLPSDFSWTGMTGYKTVSSTWTFYDSFEENDTRKTYLLPEYTNKNGELITRENNLSMSYGPIPLKYGPDPDYNSNGGKHQADIPIFRYADVILSRAEALYMKSSSSTSDKEQALEYINMIRNRAGLEDLEYSDIDTQDEFIEKLLLERSHEFWCENGQYRADLIRLGQFEKHAEALGISGVAEYKELFPLPNIVITDGQGKVIQNPGY